MKVLTVLGARPQFIKAAVVSRVIRDSPELREIIVHTGQHFDANMSDIFFEQLDIPKPNYNLGIANLNHGAMTGRMLENLEGLIKKEMPDWVLVYGDTNSTLAGALAAAKLQVAVAHVEAGLRSYNSAMPEEINRALTDRVSSLLLCPTDTAVENLRQEGFPFPATGIGTQRIENIGDVMFDAVLYYRERAIERIDLDSFGLVDKAYALCTLHRQENTDDPARLGGILSALRQIAKEIPVVLPLHPRTKAKLQQKNTALDLTGLTLLQPLPYLEMQRLQMGAKLILTDSGGMQKEAYFHRVPCITLREETEWVETVAAAANHLAGANETLILQSVAAIDRASMVFDEPFYGSGAAASAVVKSLLTVS